MLPKFILDSPHLPGTPMPWCALSAAELLMGRRIRTDVPQVRASFIPKCPHIKNFSILDERYKKLQEEYYDKCHRLIELPSLPEDQPVWVDTRGDLTPAAVLHAADTPTSYVVEVSSRQLERNHSHLRIQPTPQEIILPAEPSTTSHRPVTRLQSETIRGPPDKLTY